MSDRRVLTGGAVIPVPPEARPETSDDNRHNPADTPLPSAMFDTPDIDAAHRFLTDRKVDSVRDIQRFQHS